MTLQTRGINSSEPTDWRHFRPTCNELHFARLFWESSNSTFIEQPRLSDEDPATGYPRSIPGGRFARTIIGTGTREVGGQWVLSWEGGGTCSVHCGAVNITSASGFIQFERDPSQPIDVRIHSVPVRALWLGEQRYHADRANTTVKPEWVQMLRGLNVTCLRTMQLQNTNTSTVQSWDDERPATYYTCSNVVADDTSNGRGAPPALLLQIAVEAAVDLWVCVPHRVDEGSTTVHWVREFCRLVRDWRHPTRNVPFTGSVRFQYSNETWNTQFAANLYCRQRGQALNVDGANEYEQGWQFYAIRSEQVFQTALAARTEFGLSNQFIRVLDEQAGGGEYMFRYRSQVNPRSISPRNVAADELATGAYYAHTDFQFGDWLTVSGVVGSFTAGEIVTNGLAGGAERRGTYRFTDAGRLFVQLDVSPWAPWSAGSVTGLTSGATAAVDSVENGRVGRVAIGDGAINGWLTPAAFAALTDAQLGALCQRDMDQRVFRPVTTYSDGSFPSNPTVRVGGILATAQYAAARGLRLVIYEGGCDHINLPSAQGDAAAWGAAHARNLAWHRTAVAASLHEQSINRHIDAGVEGFWIFDDGTGWSGIHGCWSVYDDYRSGFSTQLRYLATQRAFSTGGPPQINAQYGTAEVVLRASGSAWTITTLQVNPTSGTATVRLSTTGSAWSISDYLATSGTATVRTSTTGSSFSITPPVLLEVFSGNARVVTSTTGSSVLIYNINILATSGTAVVYTCVVGSDASVRGGGSQTLYPISGEAIVRTSALGSIGELTGADGTATAVVPRIMLGMRLFPQAQGYLPAGTNVFRGQMLGWVPSLGILRPLRAGDLFAGFATETVSGYVTDGDGDIVLNREQLKVSIYQKGNVTARIIGTTPLRVGSEVFAVDDVTLTSDPNGSKVGRVLAMRGRSASVYFEGVPIRLVESIT